jgi:methionyl-tRNA formyltransferase
MTSFLFLCCYGRAGYEALQLILLRNNYGYKNLIIFTHKKNNEQLLNFIKYMKLEYYTTSINKLKDKLNNKRGLLLSIHYRNIIKKDILNCFEGRSINLHPSLLPYYKGCFSSVWAIINNEKETGITFHECVAEVDKGNIILQEKIPINEIDTGFSLFHKLITLGIQNLDKLFKLIGENYMGYVQIGEGSYYKREVPFNNIIDKNWTDDFKKRYIRALYYPPFPPPIEVPNNN